jgi:two-component system CheB/CheR fusion protein
MNTDNDSKFEALLDYLKRNRGFDGTGYKRPSLMRRVLRRIQLVNLQDYADYIDYLEVHPEEFTRLFNTLLINVTAFFRDEPAWDYLAREIIPRILADKPSNEPIRVWSAACASGEEAYTLAMLLAEALGPTEFHQRAKIYATDIDDDALNQARQANYSDKELQSVPAPLREKYFAPAGDRYVFRTDLRRSIIFGRHDLTQDAPISRLDLLLCRNALMYFNLEAQNKILSRLHFALNHGGVLFLGKAEMLITHANLFTPIELRHRIFAKTATVTGRDRLLAMVQADDGEAVNQPGRHTRLRELVFDTAPIAEIVIDLDGSLALVNDRARSLFSLSPIDLGRPLRDLELSYRPAELRSLIERAYAERRSIKLTSVERHFPDGNLQCLDVQVTPLLENGNESIGASITFEDVTRRQRLQADLQQTARELETAYEELQSTHEELETTNEELQSTNEELETTNEELQSTNEELETMNEELQSTNEELETINNELRQRTNELNNTNAFLMSILTSLRSGVVMVDRQMNVLVWNRRAEDLWGLRGDEVKGQSLLNLDIGLPVEQLPLPAILTGKAQYEEVMLTATNRRGKTIGCHITCTPFLNTQGGCEGAVLLMEEVKT